MLSHNYIGTEHILLGLLREEEGLAAWALESLDITLDAVRAQVVRIVGSGEEVTSGQIPFTPRAKKVLELALREALSLGHNYIGTEHILLGLVCEHEGVAARILLDLDADSEKIRNAVIHMLSGPGGAHTVAVGGGARATAGELVERSWLGGLANVLQGLQPDIERDLGRLPDSGDLLLALASAPDTRAAQALRAVGVELDALAAEVARVREAGGPSAAELGRAIDRATRAKRTAAAAQEYETAAGLRDEETRLRAALTAIEVGPETIAGIRARLGLDPPASEAT